MYDPKAEGERTQIASKENNNTFENKTLPDEEHMLDDDDWYTNMMSKIKEDAEN